MDSTVAASVVHGWLSLGGEILYTIYVCMYLFMYVSRLVIPSLKIKGTDRSTFAMYWGTTLNLLVMYPGFLSDSY